MRLRPFAPFLALVVLLALPVLVGGPSDGTCVPVPVEPPCAVEGETVPVVPDAPECCADLVGIGITEYDPTTGLCQHAVGALVCAACGDLVCGEAENACNCPEDCGEPCLGQGATYPIVPAAPECCPGLEGAPIYELGAAGECLSLDGAGVCIACGDDLCAAGEDRCNCAADCAEPTDCVPEAEGYAIVPPFGACCPGLHAVGCAVPFEGGCQPCSGFTFCTACGDGACGPGENVCRCPADCG